MKHLSLETSKRLAPFVKGHEGMFWVRTPYIGCSHFIDKTYGTNKQTRELIEPYPALDLAESLELLPKEIKNKDTTFNFQINGWEEDWFIGYCSLMKNRILIWLEDKQCCSKSLLLAVEECLNWLMDNNLMEVKK